MTNASSSVVDKDFRALAREAIAQGWEVLASGRHLKWVSPDGKPIFSARTPSDHRAVRNHLALMRRAGFKDTDD